MTMTHPTLSTDDEQLMLPLHPDGTRRAAIYVRISTPARGQDTPDAQLHQLRNYATSRGFIVVEEFIDQIGGAKSDREWFKRLFDAARQQRFDILITWSYDRFVRSTRELVDALGRLNELNIDFISYSEGTDTTTPHGRLLFSIMASLAEFERSLIAQRVKAGMQRAKAQGKHTGRPALADRKRQQIEKLLSQEPKPSLRTIARMAGVSPETVRSVGKSAATSEIQKLHT